MSNKSKHLSIRIDPMVLTKAHTLLINNGSYPTSQADVIKKVMTEYINERWHDEIVINPASVSMIYGEGKPNE